MVKLEYTKDIDGRDIIQDESGKQQVMMEWEKPYMEKCIEFIQPSGRVLEIGFGLGYSAHKIQTYSTVTEHVIIECSPEVWEYMEPFLKSHTNVRLVKGRWQDVMHTCGSFDTVFFDDYSCEVLPHRRIHEFLYAIAPQVKVGSRIGSYSTTNN